MLRVLVTTSVAAAIYGFTLGYAHSDLYALRNLVKLPVLLWITAALTSLAAWIFSGMMGAGLSFVEMQRVSWRMQRDAALILLSLAPVTLFVAIDLRTNDGGPLGEYDEFLGLNMVFVALAGTVALVRQARELFAARGLAWRRSSTLVVGWVILSGFIGGQAAFVLRPFFGFPATRGGSPPWFLGSTPDLRGATNFYECALQTLERPSIPGYGYPSER